jgi:SAM-dependent methyltransferase
VPRINNESFYSAALSGHKERARQVHWNSLGSQQLRFKVLRRLLPDNLQTLAIGDAGCRFGDLFFFLQKEPSPPKHYIGLEIMEPMIATARVRTGCTIISCNILHDPLPEADFYFCSGAMNILTRFETYLFIRRCFEASRQGFVFNLLKGEDNSSVYNYFYLPGIKKLGRNLGANVKIIEGYLPHDFSPAFYKES